MGKDQSLIVLRGFQDADRLNYLLVMAFFAIGDDLGTSDEEHHAECRYQGSSRTDKPYPMQAASSVHGATENRSAATIWPSRGQNPSGASTPIRSPTMSAANHTRPWRKLLKRNARAPNTQIGMSSQVMTKPAGQNQCSSRRAEAMWK